MKVRTPLIRAALALAIVAGLFAIAHGLIAIPAPAGVAISDGAPALPQDTALSMLSAYADATEPDSVVAMRIAATQALPVTLLPTVHVTLCMSALSDAMPMTLRSLAKIEHVHRGPFDM